MRIPSGKTDIYKYFRALDATDRVTPETGLSSWTVYRSRNGAAEAAWTTPTITEIDNTNMPGTYALLIDEDTTIASTSDSEEMAIRITHAGMDPVNLTIELYRRDTTSGRTLSVESDGDLTKVNTLDGHTAQTGDAFARLGAPAGASVSADVAAVKTETAAILVDTGTTLDGKIDGIKTVTDNLPDSGALTSLATAAALATVDNNVDAILVDTGTDIPASISTLQTSVNDLPTNAELATALASADDAVLTAIGNLNDLSAAEVNAEVDTALADYDGPTRAEATADKDEILAEIPDAAPTANENADALLDRSDAIEAGLTLRGAMRLQSAVLGGKVTGAGTTNQTFRNAIADTKARITATVDSEGNRSAITADVG
jgi:hypothetical protein